VGVNERNYAAASKAKPKIPWTGERGRAKPISLDGEQEGKEVPIPQRHREKLPKMVVE
jgi:hypothetical protein